MATRPLNPLGTLARVWFPLCLIGLLLLAIPSAILLVLNLLGRETRTNAWLEQALGLSYHLSIPWWAALALFLLPFLIALLYFLKLKRRPLQVPSTFLWRKSVEDLHVNSLFQWLRNNILLLLQILIVLTLIYAVLSLQSHGRARAGRHYILMIDNSASMSAVDVAPSRLEQAKQEAREEIDAHTDDDFGMVIVFSSNAEIRQSYTGDRNLLRQAVADVEPTHRTTRIGEALALADSLANPQRSTEDVASRPANEESGKERTYVPAEGIPTEVHLFSDGRFPDVPDFSLGHLHLQFHSIGQPGPDAVGNVALVTFNAVRDARSPNTLQALATIHNYRTRKVELRVQLDVIVNGNLEKSYDQPPDDQPPLVVSERLVPVAEGGQDEKEESVPQGSPGEASVHFQIPNLDDRADIVLHAHLLGVHDSFPQDDEAWLVAGTLRKARVVIVGKPNKPLSDFFNQEATQKLALVTYLDPGDLTGKQVYREPADLVIFDRCSPQKADDLPLANTLFIDAVPPPWKKEELPKVENPRILAWQAKHPLMEHLSALQDIRVAEAHPFNMKDPRVPPRTPRLLETDKDHALLLALSRQSYVDLVLAFAIIDEDGNWNTNWTQQLSFPVFLHNVLFYLGNLGDAASEETVQPGQLKALRPDIDVRTLEVTDPSGKREILQRGTRPEFLYGKTEHLGVYQVQIEGGPPRSFAVNLLDSDESNLEPRPQFQIGGSVIKPGQEHSQPRELWKWVALGALLLVLLEWVIYNRRIFI
jgi:hypothetical protein